MTVARFTNIVIASLAITGLPIAASHSIRAGLADYQMRRGTVESTEKAITLVPDQSEYYARLAWLVTDKQPRRAIEALERAVLLNPRDARSLVDLALRYEAAGDVEIAQEHLRRAAQVDRRFLPRWSLANYYFRNNNEAQFWFWAKAAAGMSYGDAEPLFRLCGRVREDGRLIDRLDIRDPGVRAAYLTHLLAQNRLDLTAFAIDRLLADNRKTDIPLLLECSDRLLQANDPNLAAKIWNNLARVGSVPFSVPSATGPQLLSNQNFGTPPTSHGFDWRVLPVDGLSVSQEDQSQGLRITFSGRQPEACELLVQLAPVRGASPYTLIFQYRLREMQGAAGLQWRVADARDGTLLGEAPFGSAEAQATAHADPATPNEERSVEFDAPAACSLVRVSLSYRRAPGTTRLEGSVVMRKVILQPRPQLPTGASRVRK